MIRNRYSDNRLRFMYRSGGDDDAAAVIAIGDLALTGGAFVDSGDGGAAAEAHVGTESGDGEAVFATAEAFVLFEGIGRYHF